MPSEQGFLRASIVATLLVAMLGIAFGLLSGSFSIAFDGAYSLGDAGMTILALWVSSLIVRSAKADALSGRLRNRFTMGFCIWSLSCLPQRHASHCRCDLRTYQCGYDH